MDPRERPGQVVRLRCRARSFHRETLSAAAAREAAENVAEQLAQLDPETLRDAAFTSPRRFKRRRREALLALLEAEA